MNALVLVDGRPQLDTERPAPPLRRGEALIRVQLSGICRTDIELKRGYMGFEGIPGHEFVGIVEESPTNRSWTGKRVVGEINCPCGRCELCRTGMGGHCPDRTVLGIAGRDGCHAEYVSLPVDNLHEVPAGLEDEEAVFTEPLAAAYRIFEQAAAARESRILVVGDGKLGILCSWVLAQRAGCSVTLLGRHPEKLALAVQTGRRNLEVISATAWSDPPAMKDRYGLVVEASGTFSGLKCAIRATRPAGTIILKSTTAAGEPINLAPLVVDEITLIGSRCGSFPRALQGLLQHRHPVRRLISERFPLVRALDALSVAERPGTLKILLDPRVRS